MRRSIPNLVVAAAALLTIVGGCGGAAAACELRIDCHLHGSQPYPESAMHPRNEEIVLPSGFEAEIVVSGLHSPTAFAFLPDERVLIAERAGQVKLLAGGRIRSRPVLDLSDRVTIDSFRGLVAVEVDPAFTTNHFVYVVYAVKREPATASSPYVRVSRFTLAGSNPTDSEVVILGKDGWRSSSCRTLAPGADCIPADGGHIGADLVFRRDGSLLVSTGDGGGMPGPDVLEPTALQAQDPDALGGKVLRITRDGKGLSTNPWFTGDPADNRSKVWAIGLRNPFRMTMAPVGAAPVVADVGWDAVDEIDTVSAGANMGWPCFEGSRRTKVYRSTPFCRGLYSSKAFVQPPSVTLRHPSTASVTGGVFCTPCAYPEPFRTAYFFGDWGQNSIRRIPLGGTNEGLGRRPVTFAGSAGGPVQFRVGPDGLLYYLALNQGELRRIRYAG